MSNKNGTVSDILIDNDIKENIYDKIVWWKKGDIIDNYMVQKLGVVFFSFASQNEMIEKVGRINDLIKVIVS